MVRTVDPITERLLDDGAAHVLLKGGGNLIVNRFLDANGDGTGNKNFNGDYSGAQEIAYIQPPTNRIYNIARMLVSIVDTSGFSAVDYGNIAGGLTNGIQVRVQDDSGTIVDLVDSEPIVSNAGWGAFCYDADLKTWSTGNEFLLVRWTFSKSGVPIKLDGSKNARLEVLMDDDLRSLIDHKFLIQGSSSDEYF